MERTDVVSPSRRRIIERPRLTRLLDETSSRIILLVAPAGYGKTTLARQWMGAAERRHGWYAATDAAADVAALAAGVAKAASAIVPGAGGRMMDRLGAVGAPPPTPVELAEVFAGDVADWPDDAWLVIDDYHFAMESEASEKWVEHVLTSAPLRILVCSRHRPTWATARRVLYGDILGLGRAILALTYDEAGDVLGSRDPSHVAGLMGLADGWPAVIGLAALTDDRSLAGEELPVTLDRYFAEELLNALSPETQRAVITLGLAAEWTLARLHDFHGSSAKSMLSAAERCGFVVRTASDRVEVHPLIRAFLAERMRGTAPGVRKKAVGRLGRLLLRDEQWDEAFTLIEQFGDPAVLGRLLEAASSKMIAGGRIATLRRWAECARNQGLKAPIVDFVEAEIAFQDGFPGQALRLAVSAAQDARPTAEWRAAAWARAGQAANFAEQLEEAVTYFGRARLESRTPAQLKEALHGLFNVAIELEQHDADSYLEEIAALTPLSVEEEIRLSMLKLFRANRHGGVESQLRLGRETLHLIDKARPFVSTGFLNTFGHSLVLSGRYTEALGVAVREVEEASRGGLAFAIPHALLVQAWALTGLRRFPQARAAIAEARSLIEGRPDEYIALLAQTAEARIEISRGRPDAALAIADPSRLTQPLAASIRGELFGVRAIAAACAGDTREALRCSKEASRLTCTTEAEVMAMAARAIVSHRRKNDSSKALRVLRRSIEAGNLDSLVPAYRGYPPFLAELSKASPHHQAVLQRLILDANDVALARAVGAASLLPQSLRKLTPREEEVLELVVQGLSNREIGARLFIAEVTVKVHLRHVFEKLGVRSRTQAAVRAALGADEDGDQLGA